MSFERSIGNFNDILENARQIVSYMEGVSFDVYRSDNKTRDAVERCLQRISEAAFRLGSIAHDVAPQLPWRDIRGLGNQLRHGYDRIDDRIIYAIITEQMPQLVQAAQSAINKLSDL